MVVQVYGSASKQSKTVLCLLIQLLSREIKERCGEKGKHDYAEQIAGG
jgi:hypothetical protein